MEKKQGSYHTSEIKPKFSTSNPSGQPTIQEAGIINSLSSKIGNVSHTSNFINININETINYRNSTENAIKDESGSGEDSDLEIFVIKI